MGRRDMTVCIAAACGGSANGEYRIVLCTDRKVGGALGSSETMLKSRIVSSTWTCLTAGEDSEIHALLPLLRSHFRGVDLDETNIVSLTRDALNQRKRDKANELIQGRYAISYDDFLATGKDRLPPDLFRAAVADVEMIELGADLIIVGFIDRFPYLLQTGSNCQVKIREDFAVVGEGAYLAHASLMHRGHSDMDPLEKAIYSVYEAKRFSEGAPSVGKDTLLTVLHTNGQNRLTSVKTDNALDAHYQKFGPKKVTTNLELDDDFFYKRP